MSGVMSVLCVYSRFQSTDDEVCAHPEYGQEHGPSRTCDAIRSILFDCAIKFLARSLPLHRYRFHGVSVNRRQLIMLLIQSINSLTIVRISHTPAIASHTGRAGRRIGRKQARLPGSTWRILFENRINKSRTSQSHHPFNQSINQHKPQIKSEFISQPQSQLTQNRLPERGQIFRIIRILVRPVKSLAVVPVLK